MLAPAGAAASSCRTSAPPSRRPRIFAFAWSFNNYEISAFTLGFQQTFPVWVYSSCATRPHRDRERDLGADLLAQVVLIWFALKLMRLRSGDQATTDMIAGTEAVAAAART